MSILVNEHSRVLVQGITGKEGSFWTKHMIEMGTQVVAGVTPGKAGQKVESVPVFNTVRDAVVATQANTSLLFVPPRFAKDAVFEALASGMKQIVVTAEGIPLHDAMAIRTAAKLHGAMVFGGNTTGIITPGVAMMGFFPYWIDRVYKPGRIGVMTRSGSLTNEITAMVVQAGLGLSTLVGIGGDLVPGTRFAEVLPLFQQDAQTDAVVIIGEIGGTMEEEVAEVLKQQHFKKPLVAFIAGWTAPQGQKMGHAGAIITSSKGTAEAKAQALEAVGAKVARRPSEVGSLLHSLL